MRTLLSSLFVATVLVACSSAPVPTGAPSPVVTAGPAQIGDPFASGLYVLSYTGASGEIVDNGLAFANCSSGGLVSTNEPPPPLTRLYPDYGDRAVIVGDELTVRVTTHPANVALAASSARAYPFESLDWTAPDLIGTDTFVAELAEPVQSAEGWIAVAPRLADGTRLPAGVYAVVLTMVATASNLVCTNGESVTVIRVGDAAP